MIGRIARVIGIILLVLLLLVIIVPLLIPVPPPEGTRPASQLADADSRFIEVNGIQVHYKQVGQGQPVIILLHGFGASTFSWREVMAPLSQLGTVIAYDRPAFGLTERPMQWTGQNPYSTDAQVDLLFGLMDKLSIQKAVLVGNSMGGGVAAKAALTNPGRVSGLVLVDPALGGGGGSPLLRLLYNTPQADHIGPLLVRQISVQGDSIIRQAWHDPSKITQSVIDGYHLPLQAENWDRALWYLNKAPQPVGLREQVKELKMPTLLVTGDDDRIVPTDQTLALAKDLPSAKLVVFKDCGHVPQEECPQDFLKAVESFVKGGEAGNE